MRGVMIILGLVAAQQLKQPREVCCVHGELAGRRRSRLTTFPRLLIGFVSNSKKATIENAISSFAHVAKVLVASWVVALYDGEPTAWAPAMEAAETLGVSLDVYDARQPGQNCSKRLCPKLQFQLPMAARLDGIDYVWLPDADMRFADLDFHKFWAWHGAAGAPLVSQPTIVPSTQETAFHVNADDWFCGGRCHALRTTFVEQQAPVLDAGFFRWLAPNLVDLANEQEKLSSGWGHCGVWCGAATLYAAGGERPACVVINAPITHLDTHTINKTTEFYSRSTRLQISIRQKRWPRNAPPNYPLHSFVDAQHALIESAWTNGTGILYNSGATWLPFRFLAYFYWTGGKGLR